MLPVHNKQTANGSIQPPSPQDFSIWFSDPQHWALQVGAYQMAWQRQWWGFVAERLRKDAALFERLAACGEPTDATRLCGEFVSEAFDDYRAEATVLAQLGSALATSASEASQNTPVHKSKPSTAFSA